MTTVNIHEAKTHLSRLVEEVAGGAEIVIAKNGVPRAKLVPLGRTRPLKFGVLKGKIRYPDDFDAPLPEASSRCSRVVGRNEAAHRYPRLSVGAR